MTTTEFWHQHALKKSRILNAKHLLFSLLFVITFVITPSSLFAQTSSSGALETVVYKFTIADVINPAEADAVQKLMMSNKFANSCSFIDEADCFKLSSNERLTYAALREALLSEGFILSAEVFLSDGTIIRSLVELNEEH